ncbi:MAG: MEKHLA domain-containing protein [Nitrospira sp. CR1.3]|nr:MEKHLA domain-containing protein [Nitrospira sp. CR1.3]
MTPSAVQWSRWLLDSYRHWTGRELIERSGSSEAQSRMLFDAPFIVVSHGVEADPILNYGNQRALDLWEATWNELVGTPSRLTAEPVNQPERERMLEAAKSRGFFDDYRGVRVSMTGRRFLVENALIWTVMDTAGSTVGQAASFSQWTRL